MGLFGSIKKRIRKEVLSNGKVKYYCERTGAILSDKWRVMTYETGSPVSEDGIEWEAIFDTLGEAEKFIGLRPEEEIHPIKSEVLITL